MTTTGETMVPRTRGRRALAAGAGATLLVAAGGAVWLHGGASADPVQTDVAATCSLGGSAVDMVVPMGVDDAVDPIAPGGAQTLRIDQGFGAMPVEVTINSLKVTTPIPEEVVSTDAVAFEGGNMAGSHEIVGTDLVVTFTGPVSSSAVEIPTVVVDQTITDAPADDLIEWKVWSEVVADTNFGVATCTPNDPALNLNTTAIDEGAGEQPMPTTAPPTTAPLTDAPVDPPADPPAQPGAPAPAQAEVCVSVSGAPVPAPGCVSVPPETDGGGEGGEGDTPAPPAPGGLPLPLPPLPVPVPPLPLPDVGGLPLPLPDGGALPLPGGGLPLPGDGLPLPLPAPGDGGLSADVGVETDVTADLGL
ncbi:hypothetical protein [Rhabdothermincola salaria]|uniref:hypothetical protein n=1 Tax=Rhabdothermincola salaria TaxID=2903142 RepID=UPI001E55F704|nr:hypothetical protein [Rhabdothermincola salaria]MCD9625413.1 hypothetical protein [Rhabdothermincola salaria]